MTLCLYNNVSLLKDDSKRTGPSNSIEIHFRSTFKLFETLFLTNISFRFKINNGNIKQKWFLFDYYSQAFCEV